MPRKYNRVIRYYDSWFADLSDPTKELTGDECWSIMLAVRECQLSGSLEPLEQLPLSIRRALSMATMGEQVIRLVETAENRRKVGATGGQTAAQHRNSPEQAAAAKMKAEKEAHEQAARDAAYEQQRKNATNPQAYHELLKRGSEGDAAALEKLRITQEQAKEYYKRAMLSQKGGKS